VSLIRTWSVIRAWVNRQATKRSALLQYAKLSAPSLHCLPAALLLSAAAAVAAFSLLVVLLLVPLLLLDLVLFLLGERLWSSEGEMAAWYAIS
jgi:hypothetical protein